MNELGFLFTTQYKKVQSDCSRPCFHLRMVAHIPMIAPRSLILTQYEHVEDDAIIYILSSLGNESLLDKHKELLGDDVVATLDVSYIKFSPKYDASGEVVGTEIVQVTKSNPNGDLPDYLKHQNMQY